MTNEKFSMTNSQFRLNALVAACRAATLHPGALAFLPHSLGLSNQGQSNSIKVNQSDSVGQAGGPNRM
jgi:hypothetical protein